MTEALHAVSHLLRIMHISLSYGPDYSTAVNSASISSFDHGWYISPAGIGQPLSKQIIQILIIFVRKAWTKTDFAVRRMVAFLQARPTLHHLSLEQLLLWAGDILPMQLHSVTSSPDRARVRQTSSAPQRFFPRRRTNTVRTVLAVALSGPGR